MTLPSPLITTQHLSIGYDARHPVMQDFNSTLYAGQFVGIFGANGAGKTTLLRTILGRTPPISGSLHIEKTAGIGYMPQSISSIPPTLSGKAILAASIHGNRWGLPYVSSAARQHIAHIVGLVEAETLLDRPFAELSGGERRRVLLAQALLGNPRLLLLDEPLANLDPHYQQSFISLLSHIHQTQGVTILLTAHDMNPLMGTMTHILYLAGGKAAIGSVEQVVNNKVLSQLYGSPIEVFTHHGQIFVMHRNTGQIENVSCH
jgi:zinc/manganese transport system ATP-binding protein